MKNIKKRGLFLVEILQFLGEHLVEIFFGLVAAGALAGCKYLHATGKKYKSMIQAEKEQKIEEHIDAKLQPIIDEIEDLRVYIREVGKVEKSHMNLIIASYRYRLIQLCKQYIKQGYITPEQYDQLSEFYKVYHGLGGNGQAEEYYERAIALENKNVQK